MSCEASAACSERALFLAPALSAPSIPFRIATVAIASTTAPTMTSIEHGSALRAQA